MNKLNFFLILISCISAVTFAEKVPPIYHSSTDVLDFDRKISHSHSLYNGDVVTNSHHERAQDGHPLTDINTRLTGQHNARSSVPAAKQTTAKPSNANNCGKILLRLLS